MQTDGKFTLQATNKLVQSEFTKAIQNFKGLLEFETVINFSLIGSEAPPFLIPSEIDCCFLEVESSFVQCFSVVPFEDLIFLLTSLLLETPLIINSEHQGLLGATLLTLVGLMKPFKWPYPIVFSLHLDMSELVSSPTPIIVGLNKEQKSLGKLFEANSLRDDAIFLDIDKGVYRYSKEIILEENAGYLRAKAAPIEKKYKELFSSKKPRHQMAFSECESSPLVFEKPKKLSRGHFEHQMKEGKVILRFLFGVLMEIAQMSSGENPRLKEKGQVGPFEERPSGVSDRRRKEKEDCFISKFFKTQIFQLHQSAP